MAVNTEMIDKLVSEEALKGLDTLDKKLIASYEEMERNLAVVQKLVVAYDGLNKTMGDTSKYATESEKATKASTKAAQDAKKAEEDRKRIIEESIKAEREQTKATEEHINVIKKAEMTTKQLLSVAKETAKGIDISAYIKKNEDGMVSYSGAINAANQQLGRIEGLQEALKTAFNEGSVSESEYTSIVSELTQKQQEYGVVLEDLHKKYEAAKEAQRAVFAPASEAFNQLSSDVQEQTYLLVGMNAELNETKTAQKDLEKSYKDGSISLGEYIEKKAQLNALESKQSEEVKKLSRELQLNAQIAKTAEGSYDNLSARYSLMKIEINALGEAEGANVQQKRALEKEAKALYERMNDLQKATGKSQLQVGDYALANNELTSALNTVSPALGGAVTGINAMTKSAMVFIATPLGMTLAAIAAVLAVLSAWFTRTEEGQSALAVGGAVFDKVLSSILNVATKLGEVLYRLFTEPKQTIKELGQMLVDNIINRFRAIGMMGEAIVKILKGDISEGFKDLGNAALQNLTGVEDVIGKITDGVTEMSESIQRAIEIQQGLNNLEVKKRDLMVEEAKSLEELEKLREIANDQEKSHAERLAANNEYLTKANTLSEKSVAIAKEEFELRKAQILENKKETELSIEEKNELAKLEANMYKISADHSKKIQTGIRANNRLRKEGIAEANKLEKERIREHNKEMKAIGELESFNYRKSADYQQQLLRDTSLAFDERKDALEQYIADEKRILEVKRDEEVKQEGLSVNQIKLIREKAAYEIYKLELKQDEELRNLKISQAEREVKLAQDAISERSEMMNQQLQDDLVREAKLYEEQIKQNVDNEEKREKITEDYQRRRLETIRKYNQDAFEYEVEQLQQTLDNTELTEEQKLKLHKKIDDLRKKNAKDLAEFEIQQTEEKVDKMLSIEERFNKALNDKRTQAVLTMWGMAQDMASMYYDSQLQQIDALEKREKQYYDDKLAYLTDNVEAGLMSQEEADARKKILDDAQQEREKGYEQKRKEIQQRQAKWDKANSIVQAGISTAVAVTKALPNLILAGIVGAMGAAQIAMIAAQKIPEYAKGTDYHKGGLAWVGDGGRSEMVILPSGEVWKTPSTDTLVNLPRGTEVLPDFRQAMMNIGNHTSLAQYDDESGKMVFINDEVLRSNTKETNKQLSAINKGISVIRSNNAYTNKKNNTGYRFRNNLTN